MDRSITIRNMKFLAILSFLFLSQLASQLTWAEVHFEKKILKIGSQVLSVEIADTSEKTAQGLMFRKDLPEGTGMLFVFPDEQTRGFWMKNTFIPLAIGFFNAKKELVDIQEMAPAASGIQVDFPTYNSKAPAQYALEVPKGWFARHKIRLKQRFSFL